MKINKKVAIASSSAVLIVAVAAGIVAGTWGSSSGESPASRPAPAMASPTLAVPPPVAGGFGNPTTDLVGRKVMQPKKPHGQLLPQHDAGQRVDCALPQQPTSPGGVEIEQTFGLPTLFSTTDGPTRFDGDTPVGYAHTPQGAALAAAAFYTKTFDDPARAIKAAIALGNASPAANAKAAAEAERMAGQRQSSMMKSGVLASEAFRVLSCDNDFAAVELAIPMPVDQDGNRLDSRKWYGVRMNLAWRNGDWKVLETPKGAQYQVYTSLEGWTTWVYN